MNGPWQARAKSLAGLTPTKEEKDGGESSAVSHVAHSNSTNRLGGECVLPASRAADPMAAELGVGPARERADASASPHGEASGARSSAALRQRAAGARCRSVRRPAASGRSSPVFGFQIGSANHDARIGMFVQFLCTSLLILNSENSRGGSLNIFSFHLRDEIVRFPISFDNRHKTWGDEMKVSVFQMAVVPSLANNTETIVTAIREAAASKVDVIVFPETALTGYLGISLNKLDDLDPVAVHDALTHIQAQCRDAGVAAVVGQYFKRCGFWFNNSVAIDRHGRIVASYDKCQLVDQDCYSVTPGDRFPVFTLDGVTCSMAICHDIRYPEILLQYGRARSQVHFHLFYGIRNRRDISHQHQYDAHLITRAVENGFFFAGANASENEQMVRSQIVSPDGVVCAKAESWRTEQLHADIDAGSAGDGWAAKRRFDLFDAGRTGQRGSYFEQAVWENKPYMIKHDRRLLSDQ
jgi:omega-amidase